MTERLAKVISACGYCSRRNAEKLIIEGKVKVNNVIAVSVTTFVDSSEDVIEVEGVMLYKPSIKLWQYYKPRGLITTHNDPKGRPTIFDNIKINTTHIISVGRLDIESEGMLLLTNSGQIARQLELPQNNFSRVYKVKAYGKFTQNNLKDLEKGIVHNGIQYKPASIKLEKSNKTNHWFEVIIHEGKNREIRNMFESLGMMVNRLIRISYGPFQIDDMKKGEIREVNYQTLESFVQSNN